MFGGDGLNVTYQYKRECLHCFIEVEPIKIFQPSWNEKGIFSKFEACFIRMLESKKMLERQDAGWGTVLTLMNSDV